MERRDFFISYTKRDKAWAVWVANVLISLGYTVYMQESDIQPGNDFLEKMEEFLENSENFIAIWSEGYSKSRYCMNELRAAYHQWHSERMECILPVRIDNFPIKALYAALVYVDLPDRGSVSEATLMDAVLKAVPRSLSEQEKNLPNMGVTLTDDMRRAIYEQEKKKKEEEEGKYLYQLGENYRLGDSVKKDYTVAKVYYELAAQKGNANALFSLGWLYEYGHGVDVNYEKALDYYQTATDAGHPFAAMAAMNVKASRAKLEAKKLYSRGRYSEYQGETLENRGELVLSYREYSQALYYYQKAADAGDKGAAVKVLELTEKFSEEAMERFNQVCDYRDGLGVDIDYAKARHYYEQAAAKGDAEALCSLGYLYEYGKGVDIDLEKALYYYQTAFSAGYIFACINVAEVRAKLNKSRGS